MVKAEFRWGHFWGDWVAPGCILGTRVAILLQAAAHPEVAIFVLAAFLMWAVFVLPLLSSWRWGIALNMVGNILYLALWHGRFPSFPQFASGLVAIYCAARLAGLVGPLHFAGQSRAHMPE